MNNISNYNKTTPVKILAISFLMVFSFSSLNSFAESSSSSDTYGMTYKATMDACIKENKSTAANCVTLATDAAKAAVAAERGAGSEGDKEKEKRAACAAFKKDLDTTMDDIGKACTKGGLGNGSSCAELALTCAESAGEQNYDNSAQLSNQMGLSQLAAASGNQNAALLATSLNITPQIDAVDNACPQWSGKDFYSEKEKLQKELKQNKDDLVKLQEDQAKAKDEFNKDVQDLQESLNKASKEYDKAKRSLSEKKRQQLNDFNNSQNQIKEQLRTKASNILSLQGTLTSSQQDQAMQLIALTDASGKRACNKAVNDAKKAYDAVATGATSSYIATAKARKADLLAVYNDCMSAFQQQRIALNKKKKSEQDQIRQQITNETESQAELNNSIASSQSQYNEIVSDMTKEEQEATTDLNNLMTANQNKLQSAQQKQESTLSALSTKNVNLTQEQNRINTALAQLGARPATSKSSDYSAKDATTDLASAVSKATRILDSSNEADCKIDTKGSYKKSIDTYKELKDSVK